METATRWVETILGSINPGYLTLGLIRPALDLFRSETVAPNLSTLMVVIAAILLINFRYRRIGPAAAILDARIAFLKQCRSPGAFYDRIDQFDTLMMNAGFLAHGWSEFIEACLFTRKEGKVNVEVSIRPGVFINLDDAEHAGLHIRWFHHLSGIFVGTGLLLTFVGLVAALYFSSTAINMVIDGAQGLSASEQTKAIQKALAQLLNTATFKFLTSIAGLGCSLVLAFFQRTWTARLEQKFQELCRELERCTIIVTPEQLANRQQHELSTQSELLRGLPGQVGPEFSRTLESVVTTVLPGVLETAMAGMAAKLDEACQAIVNSRQAPLQAMAAEFSATIAASTGREIRAVVETLSGLPLQIKAAADPLAALPGQISAATGDLQRTLMALTRGLEAFHARIIPPAEPVPGKALADEIGRGLAGLRAELGALAARPEAGAALVAEFSLAMSRIEATLHGNAATITAALEGLRDHTTAGSHALADETGRAVAELSTAAKGLGSALQAALSHLQERSDTTANDIAERFLDATQAAREASSQQAARIEDAIGKIAAAGLRAGQDVSDAAKAATQTLDRRAGETADQITGLMIENSQQVLARFGVSVDRLWQHIDGLGRSLETVEGRLAGHATALEGINRAARETETAFEGSARAVAAAAAPLARTGEAMVHSMQTLAHTVETTVATLKESQHQGQNLAADLRETLQRLQIVWTQHSSRFTDVDDSLSRVLTSIIEHVDAHGAALRDHVVKIDTHLAQTVNNLAGNVEALQETAAELTRAVSVIQKIVEKLPPAPQVQE